jgi:hypothetical protein
MNKGLQEFFSLRRQKTFSLAGLTREISNDNNENGDTTDGDTYYR